MPSIRFPCAALALAAPLIVIAPARAQQDQYNAVTIPVPGSSMSAEQAARCAQLRNLNYGRENYRLPADCQPAGVVQGEVRPPGIYEGGSVPTRDGAGDVFSGGSVPQFRGTAGIFGPDPPPPIEGGVSNVTLRGNADGAGERTGYPTPTAIPNPGARIRGGVTGRPRVYGGRAWFGRPGDRDELIIETTVYDGGQLPLHQLEIHRLPEGRRHTHLQGSYTRPPTATRPGNFHVIRLWRVGGGSYPVDYNIPIR